MPPYGLYSLTDRVNLPEELGAEGYRNINAFSPGLDSDFRQSLYQYDPAFGQLNATQRYLAAPYTGPNAFQAMFDISPTYFEGTNIGQLPYDIPSYGGVSGYRNVGGIDTLPVVQKDFRDYNFQDFYNYNTRDQYDPEKDDYQVKEIQGPEPRGIGKLMEVLGNIPTPLNLLRKMLSNVGPGFVGPKGSRAYGDESLFSTFGRSRTGAEFFQNLRDRKARQEAAQRGLEKQKEKARLDMTKAIRDIRDTGGDRSTPTTNTSTGPARAASSWMDL